MVTIGIDASVNSTSICVHDSKDDKITYYHLTNLLTISKSKSLKNDADWISKSDLLTNLTNYDGINGMYFRSPAISSAKRKKDINSWHTEIMDRAYKISNILCDAISPHLNGLSGTDEFIISFEHYSYGSPSDTLVQLVEITSFMKLNIINMFKPVNGIEVYPSPSVKAHFGKGNYNKFDMLNLFKNIGNESDPLLNFLNNEDESIYITQIQETPTVIKNKVESPINDMVDSFFIMEYCRVRNLKSKI